MLLEMKMTGNYKNLFVGTFILKQGLQKTFFSNIVSQSRRLTCSETHRPQEVNIMLYLHGFHMSFASFGATKL